jgi:hypothetical protein
MYFENIFKIIATPIVASACPGMFKQFIESVAEIITIYDEKFQKDFFARILKFTSIQVENLYYSLNTEDFNLVNDFEGVVV